MRAYTSTYLLFTLKRGKCCWRMWNGPHRLIYNKLNVSPLSVRDIMVAASIKECKNDFHWKVIEKWTQTLRPCLKDFEWLQTVPFKSTIGTRTAECCENNEWNRLGFQYITRKPFTWQPIFRVNTCCSSTLEIRVAFDRTIMAIKMSYPPLSNDFRLSVTRSLCQTEIV